MEEAIAAINEKYNDRITDLETKLAELRAKRQSVMERVKAYYAAVRLKEEAEKVINKGKPVI